MPVFRNKVGEKDTARLIVEQRKTGFAGRIDRKLGVAATRDGMPVQRETSRSLEKDESSTYSQKPLHRKERWTACSRVAHLRGIFTVGGPLFKSRCKNQFLFVTTADFAGPLSAGTGARKKRRPPALENVPVAPTSTWPSGENINPLNVSPRCRMVSNSCSVAIFQNLSVLSSLELANVFPAGENATERTACLCPVQVASSLPEETSHTRMASS